MDKKPRRSARSSKSEEEDPIESLVGNLSTLKLGRAKRSFVDSKKAGTEDGLLFDPADYSEGELDEMLDKFFEISAPSKVKRSDGIGWIRVLSSSYEEEGLGNLEDLENDWEKLKASKKTINFDAIKEMAISNWCLGGIWLLFVNTAEEIDTTWEKIARATVKGKLGTHTKVTPVADTKEGKDLYGAQHVVSVYTKDFTDKSDVLKVEAALRRLGLRERIVFKPRVYSSLGVYSQNEWNLRPGIYTSHWDARKLAGNIRDITKGRETYMINIQDGN
ncbi:UPF0696 protein C11orf68 homolog [Acanthaster planci]|uniref:UPF0696 protein C11orf68 homolog n=1 Tax=Acanthaster planci TaxID=133434 RepID=A0A8B7YCF7_ACAPL|nr:UPF0696 protein C11orf68 homolog [Acanthaster planci]XP_022090934.1 UPF0696 protein C11orf68 homolog [Acanthaster planci]XP_022090935.1 UPF0696 protein C11orf68 homolog [Acanthaster planci]XP_022090936.1 UPF0696 protein C11orf68 homolog [Acanthaster planci]